MLSEMKNKKQKQKKWQKRLPKSHLKQMCYDIACCVFVFLITFVPKIYVTFLQLNLHVFTVRFQNTFGWRWLSRPGSQTRDIASCLPSPNTRWDCLFVPHGQHLSAD